MERNYLDAIAGCIDRLDDADSLADTPVSGLFHAARTSSPRVYSSVTVQVRVRDGRVETSEPVKTRQGEHLRGTDAWDGTLSLPVRPFMEVRTARMELSRQLRDLGRRYQQRATRQEVRS